MEDKNLIKYKWDSGVYSLEDMVKLVLDNIINEEQFFSITSYNFRGVYSQINKKN